ncbi:MAG: EAL domain-containing protein, partial [Lachnospiraceae bacterium]|nr:EAL domain-containing protein [Lachnospiraceae bacterium]
ITIEITESTIGSSFDFMKEQVERFQKLGFPVWMDDFGSGYSSLDVLQSIKFDLIKFDMSFMRKLDAGVGGRIIMSELMRMATALGVDTVCEGVETEAQIRFLKEIGCSKLQGYYYSKPLPFETILSMYRNRDLIENENPAEAEYYESIGRANLFDLGVIAGEKENSLANAFNALPIAVLETGAGKNVYIRSNRSYQNFIKRFFNVDIWKDPDHFEDATGGCRKDFISAVKKRCTNGNPAFFDRQLPDGSIAHFFTRRISVNPLSQNAAFVIAVLSISKPDESATYADIARALAADYYNIYVIDLDSSRYIEYSSQVGDEDLVLERHGGDFFESARKDILIRVYEEDREALLKLFTKENVLRELDSQGVFTAVYRLIDSGRPTYASMKITRMHGGSRIILGVSNVDAQMKQQEEEKKLRQEAISLGRIASLSPNYIALYTVDPASGHYTQYNPSKELKRFGLAQQGEDFFADVITNAPGLIVPEDMGRYLRVLTKNNMMREIRENGLFFQNYRIFLDGKSTPVNLRATLTSEEGREKLLIGVTRDDREDYRRRLEEAYEKARDTSTIYTHIALSLARECTDLFYVNMDTNELIEFHTDDKLGLLTEARRSADFFEGCERDAKIYIHPDDQAAFIHAMTRDYLSKALDKKRIFEMTYRRIKNGRTFYVRMKVSRMEDDKRFIVIAVSDIDEEVRQQRAEKKMKEERVIYARLHAITGSFICVYVVDPKTGRYHEFSSSTDYDKNFSQAKNGADFFSSLRESIQIYSHPEDTSRVLSLLTRDNLLKETKDRGIFTLGYRLMADGKPVHFQLKAAMVTEEEGPRLIVGINNIDTQVKQEEEFEKRLAKAQSLANIDALTGVKNKHAYLEAEVRMDRLIANHRQMPFAIVMLDVNDLKKINDTKGHQAGDQYLRSACRIICEIFKHSPVFRVGGDEFAVISQGIDYECMDERIEEMRLHNEEAMRSEGIVIACGMSRFMHDDCVAPVFKRADDNMYENKSFLKASRPEEDSGS